MANPQTLKPIEIIAVDSDDVSCNGGGAGVGHPRVFLRIDRHEGQVVCPYCSRTYVHRYKHS